MKKTILLVLVFLLSISLFGCTGEKYKTQTKNEIQNSKVTGQSKENDEKAVADLVKAFGQKLQMVSLQAPEDILKKSMQENYGEFVSPALLAKWEGDPLNSPGRLTSSPWPDRIEILALKKISDISYEVKGEIIEITSVEKEKGGAAEKRPITLIVNKIDNRWLIDQVTLGEYRESKSTEYKNAEYGFSFTLPNSWRNFSIISDKWKGLSVEGSDGEKVVESGPIISIRHPQWTSKNPRQDIPIMIFTLRQWNLLQQDKFHIGAAPIGPSELGRNEKYVFALPARYNFAFPTGYEEVESILKNNPLHTN